MAIGSFAALVETEGRMAADSRWTEEEVSGTSQEKRGSSSQHVPLGQYAGKTGWKYLTVYSVARWHNLIPFFLGLWRAEPLSLKTEGLSTYNLKNLAIAVWQPWL